MDGVEVEIVYARPLDVDERIADVVFDRGLEALRGFYGNYEATGTDPLSDLYCYAITHKKASIGHKKSHSIFAGEYNEVEVYLFHLF